MVVGLLGFEPRTATIMSCVLYQLRYRPLVVVGAGPIFLATVLCIRHADHTFVLHDGHFMTLWVNRLDELNVLITSDTHCHRLHLGGIPYSEDGVPVTIHPEFPLPSTEIVDGGGILHDASAKPRAIAMRILLIVME